MSDQPEGCHKNKCFKNEGGKTMYRKAVLSDSKGLHALVCELEATELSYEKFYDILNEQLQDRQHYYCLLCERDNSIVAVLNLRIERQLHHAGPVAEIMEFCVCREYRGMGIGKEMFVRACEISKAFKCSQIEVTCNKGREAAAKFYEKAGMKSSHFKYTMEL